jgi:ATP-dependent DNA ligase
MEALLVEEIPTGPGWQYEPKWDGFRAIAFRDGKDVFLQSKSEQPLGRYFPEVLEALLALDARRFVLDGELVVPAGRSISFDALLQRIHPAASRVARLARETPAIYIVFDLLAGTDGESLTERTLAERRPLLENFAREHFARSGILFLSPASTELSTVRQWLERTGGALDGVIAKRLDLEYRSGDRTGMQKVKKLRTADCVAGGFRYASASKKLIGSILLGLYDGEGKLHHVGFTSSFPARERGKLLRKLKPLVRPPGFTGRAPGGPSRWSTKRSTEWEPLAPSLVLEVRYDHFSEGRFRHGTKFLRWRPDKPARRCTIDQVESESRTATLRLLRPAARTRSNRTRRRVVRSRG